VTPGRLRIRNWPRQVRGRIVCSSHSIAMAAASERTEGAETMKTKKIWMNE
jgi:hypothetical protein